MNQKDGSEVDMFSFTPLLHNLYEHSPFTLQQAETTNTDLFDPPSANLPPSAPFSVSPSPPCLSRFCRPL